jgi:hypothetical protein
MPKRKRINDIDIEPTGNGKVHSFSGAGINAQFESSKEADDHQDWLDTREALRKNPLGLKTYKIPVNGIR